MLRGMVICPDAENIVKQIRGTRVQGRAVDLDMKREIRKKERQLNAVIQKRREHLSLCPCRTAMFMGEGLKRFQGLLHSESGQLNGSSMREG